MELGQSLIWNDLSSKLSWLLGGWMQEAQTVSGREVGMRRLITLIFVDRDKPAIMVVIRRELPRTTGADSG